MEKIDWNKIKTTIKKWKPGEYVRQTSIVVIGVLITFVGSELVTRCSEQADIKSTMLLIGDELKSNRKNFEEIMSEFSEDERLSALLVEHDMDIRSIPEDSLKQFRFILGHIRSYSYTQNALDILKSSMLMQKISDKELLLSLTEIYETLEDIKNMNFFSHMDYLVNLGYLNILFNSKEYNKYFLDIVDKIIGKGKIEYKFLIPFINSKLKEAFIKEEKDEFVKGEDNYFTATLRAYTFIYYLYKLDKFKNKGIEGVEDMTFEMWKLEDFNSKEEVFEDYFNKNKAFFDTDSKKAVFMIGYLSKKLINLQATQEGGRKPFMSNLNGLNLTKKDLVRLLPKIQGKFMEYKKEYYNEELLYTSQYLINSNNLNDLSNLDIPLYFSLGMNMVKKFDLNTKEEEVDNDNE